MRSAFSVMKCKVIDKTEHMFYSTDIEHVF